MRFPASSFLLNTSRNPYKDVPLDITLQVVLPPEDGNLLLQNLMFCSYATTYKIENSMVKDMNT